MRSILMNGVGLVASIIFVLGTIAIATRLRRMQALTVSTARKAIHIVLSHWWLIALILFDDPWVASVGPAASLAAASFLPCSRLVPTDEKAARTRDRGTICYSAALLILVNLAWRGLISERAAVVGVFVMGWGDGLAGLVGARFGRAGIYIWGRRKTIQGTTAMFLVSLAVTLLIILVMGSGAASLPTVANMSFSIAVVATTLEVFTPLGLDNLTIPLGTAAFIAGAFG